MNKYFNINKILPYQRNFNLINGKRSIGKTYTTQKFVLDKCINKDVEFIYIVRTQDEKKKRVFELGFEKVLINEFKGFEISTSIEDMYIINGEEKRQLGYCIALSEAVKIKKRSFPKVKYIIFDEYMLELKQSTQYVNGWNEPDLLLSIYHTVDREEDRVVCFLLGNNTSFYNPYHLHKAFKVKEINVGEIWYSENVLFYWAESSEELEQEKSKSKFLKMLNGTEYGRYAKDGEYIGDNKNFVSSVEKNVKYMMTIEYNGEKYSVLKGKEVLYITQRINKGCDIQIALTKSDHSENTILTKSKNNSLLKWIGEQFKLGNIRYDSIETKTKFDGAITMIL